MKFYDNYSSLSAQQSKLSNFADEGAVGSDSDSECSPCLPYLAIDKTVLLYQSKSYCLGYFKGRAVAVVSFAQWVYVPTHRWLLAFKHNQCQTIETISKNHLFASIR